LMSKGRESIEREAGAKSIGIRGKQNRSMD
jgi:hypothetical protein